jgi:hypothetical protein
MRFETPLKMETKTMVLTVRVPSLQTYWVDERTIKDVCMAICIQAATGQVCRLCWCLMKRREAEASSINRKQEQAHPQKSYKLFRFAFVEGRESLTW